jgi:hypothetical protein
MAIKKYNDFIRRIGTGHWYSEPIYSENSVATASSSVTGVSTGLSRLALTKRLPNPLPSGVTGYIPTSVSIMQTYLDSAFVFAAVDLGRLTLDSTTAGVFTDGVAMPTKTELGSSNATYSAVLAEVTTTLSATPGSFTITYVDQAGNSAETSPSHTLTASAAVRSGGFVRLNSDDIGVRDITTATRSGSTTSGGVIQFWGVKPIAYINTSNVNNQIFNFIDLINGQFNPIVLDANELILVFSSFGSATGVGLGSIYIVADE